MDEPDDFGQQPLKKSELRAQAQRFHELMTVADLEDMQDSRRAVGVRLYRFVILLGSEVNRTELARRAAALTYTTILSLFPLLAVISAFASQFYTPEKEAEFMGYIEKQFLPSVEKVPLIGLIGEDDLSEFEKEQSKVQNIRQFFSGVSDKFRANAGGVGIFGFIGLLVTSGLLYYSIESVVNQTWQEGGGQWTRTLTNFVTMLVFAPIVIGLSLAATGLAFTLLDPNLENPTVVEEVVTELADDAVDGNTPAEIEDSEVVGPPSPEVLEKSVEEFNRKGAVEATEENASPVGVAPKQPEQVKVSPTLRRIRSVTMHFSFMLKLMPVFVNTILLAIAYAFLPKTRVKFRYAIVGALVAALLWEGARYLFVYYMYWSRVNRSLADAFGLAVVFLIWVYITWLVLLLGNLIVYLTQNFSALWSERRTGAEIALDSRLYLATMLLLTRRFGTHGGGYSEHDLRMRLGLNTVEFRRIIARLIRLGYVSLLKDGCFQLAKPPENIKAREILMHGCNLSNLPVARRGRTALGKIFESLEQRAVEICGEGTLRDLINTPLPGQTSKERNALPDDGDKKAVAQGMTKEKAKEKEKEIKENLPIK